MFRFLSIAVVQLAVTASEPAVAAILVHNYQLNGNANDTLNLAPAALLTTDGGSFVGSGYAFAANQGLQLKDGFSYLGDFSNNYSVVLDFNFSRVDGYRKVIDFNNKGSDTGFYVNFSGIRFYNVVAGSGVNVVTANTQVQLTLTRDVTGIVKGYVGNALQFTFNDTTNLAVFSAANNIARFFEDDNVTSGPTNIGESSAGTVERLLIYKGVLAANEIPPPATTSVAAPEPAALTLWAAGVLGGLILGARRRPRAKAAVPCSHVLRMEFIESLENKI